MNNLADLIEEFILRKLSREAEDIVVLKRNQIAEELECAPSQVSYVLSTRFTIDRGYIVESRRGLGGFIRIAKIPIQHMVYGDAADQMDDATSAEQVEKMIRRLRGSGFLTGREAALFSETAEFLFEHVNPALRTELLRRLLMTLANYSS